MLDTLKLGPVVLIGSSLGGAVALQCAVIDPRISAVVAAETFSDLRTVATERAPKFFSAGMIGKAFRIAEMEAGFRIDDVSPVTAASHLAIPVLLIHGEKDTDTPPSHSQRIFDALGSRKQIILVPGARHNQSLNGPIWTDIESWVDQAIPPA